MLLKIAVSDVRLGMHIHKLDGPWSDHPFWRMRFVLKNADDLTRLLASRTQTVWIDTDKSAPGIALPQALPSDFVESSPPAPTPLAATAASSSPAVVVRTESSLDDELPRAWQLRQQGAKAAAQAFADARLGKALDLEGCRVLVDEVVASAARHHGALISLCRMKERDEYTYLHSLSVCALMAALGLRLGLDADACRAAALGGFLHDIGKTRLPLSILNKPSSLTETEYTLVKAHPTLGYAILLEVGETDPVVLDVCLHHHEKMDGSGYPGRLRGEAISLFARIGAVCDVYDAVTSDRPYKSGWDPAEAIARMATWTDHLDRDVMNAFIHTVGIYPPGSLVRLASGRLGVVIENHRADLTAPVVKVFHSTKSGLPIPVQTLDLSDAKCRDHIVSREPVQDWKFPQLHALWSEDIRFRVRGQP